MSYEVEDDGDIPMIRTNLSSLNDRTVHASNTNATRRITKATTVDDDDDDGDIPMIKSKAVNSILASSATTTTTTTPFISGADNEIEENEESEYDEMTWYDDDETLNDPLQSFDEITLREEDDVLVAVTTTTANNNNNEHPIIGDLPKIEPATKNTAVNNQPTTSPAVKKEVTPSSATALEDKSQLVQKKKISSPTTTAAQEEDPLLLVPKMATNSAAVKSTIATQDMEPHFAPKTPIRISSTKARPLFDKATEMINPFYDPLIKANTNDSSTMTPWDTPESLKKYEQEHGNAHLVTIQISKETRDSRAGMTVACIGGFLFCVKINKNGLLAATNLQVGDVIVEINQFSFRKFPNAKHAYGKFLFWVRRVSYNSLF